MASEEHIVVVEEKEEEEREWENDTVWPEDVKVMVRHLLQNNGLPGLSQEALDSIDYWLKKGEVWPSEDGGPIVRKTWHKMDKPALELYDEVTRVTYDNLDDYLKTLGAGGFSITCVPCNVKAHSLDAYVVHLLAHSWRGDQSVRVKEYALGPEFGTWKDHSLEQRTTQIREEYPHAIFYDDVGIMVVDGKEKFPWKKKQSQLWHERETVGWTNGGGNVGQLGHVTGKKKGAALKKKFSQDV